MAPCVVIGEQAAAFLDQKQGVQRSLKVPA
jgi:hypothetical protein